MLAATGSIGTLIIQGVSTMTDTAKVAKIGIEYCGS